MKTVKTMAQRDGMEKKMERKRRYQMFKDTWEWNSESAYRVYPKK